MCEKKENKQKVVDNMKVIYEKDIEVNNEIKGNLGKQQDDIKHLKKQYDINNEDKVQEIAAAKTPTKKNKADYVTCKGR